MDDDFTLVAWKLTI